MVGTVYKNVKHFLVTYGASCTTSGISPSSATTRSSGPPAFASEIRRQISQQTSESLAITCDLHLMFIISRLGARPGTTSCPATKEKKPKVSTICNLGNFNDVLYHKASCTTYFFRGHSMWRMDNGKKASNRERISSKFPGLPGYVDAAYSRNDGSMVFFKSDRCVSCCITGTNNVQRSREVGHHQNINCHSCRGGPYWECRMWHPRYQNLVGRKGLV